MNLLTFEDLAKKYEIPTGTLRYYFAKYKIEPDESSRRGKRGRNKYLYSEEKFKLVIKNILDDKKKIADDKRIYKTAGELMMKQLISPPNLYNSREAAFYLNYTYGTFNNFIAKKLRASACVWNKSSKGTLPRYLYSKETLDKYNESRSEKSIYMSCAKLKRLGII